MNAWGKSLDADKKSGIRFLGDAAGEFTRAWDLEFPAAPMLGTNRSKRYAIVTQDGKVKSVHIEPDNVGAEGMLLHFREFAIVANLCVKSPLPRRFSDEVQNPKYDFGQNDLEYSWGDVIVAFFYTC